MPRIASRLVAITFCFVLLLSCQWAHGDGGAFAPKTLDGNSMAVYRWPAIVITTRSPDDLNESMRCATRASSWEQAFWILNFAWSRSESAMRLAAAKLLKSEFMKSRSAILGSDYRDAPRIMLVDSNGSVLWSSADYPTEDEWDEALSIWDSNPEP